MNRAERREAARQSRRPPAPVRIRPHEKLAPDQLRDLSLSHIANLDTIAHGTATPDNLWQWVAGMLTWLKAAELIGAGAEEMQAQRGIATAVIERFRRTGLVRFSGPEHQLAKLGLGYMDDLAALTPKVKALQAASWSENRLNELVKHQGVQQ